MVKKRGTSVKATPKADPDSAVLKRHQFHTAMARKHAAHADLIEAKLKTQGKRIDRYGSYPATSEAKPKIVKYGT